MRSIDHPSDPGTPTQGWFARQMPANRRLRRAEAERLHFVRSVVMRADVVGVARPDAVEGWSSATSLDWLEEHRNDRPAS